MAAGEISQIIVGTGVKHKTKSPGGLPPGLFYFQGPIKGKNVAIKGIIEVVHYPY